MVLWSKHLQYFDELNSRKTYYINIFFNINLYYILSKASTTEEMPKIKTDLFLKSRQHVAWAAKNTR